ncbi:MAG: DNA polymerase III subunit beta [Phycisphaerae bacterium]
MKLRFNRQEMAEALSAICSVVAARTPKPVLQCVRIDARPDVVLLSATDLELGLRCSVMQVEVDEPGETLAAADTLARIVRECEDEVLSIETTETMLQVRGAGSHFQIVSQDVADFPPVPTTQDAPGFTIELSAIKRLIEWTAFASARESTRYAINGVLWEIEGDRLTLAATDGRRLSVAHAPLASRGSTTTTVSIVPTKALALIARLPADPEAPVGVNMSTNQLLVRAGGAIVSTSLVEGNFPNYQDVMPTDCDREMVVSTSAFLGALRRAALLTNEESKGVRLRVTEGELTLTSRAPEQGEATVSLPISYSGEPLEIGFNPVFLLDVLKVAHTEEITLLLKSSERPGVIRLGEEFVYVVMPVNLESA